MIGELARERTGDLLARVCELRHRCMHDRLDDLGLYKGQPLMLRVLWAQDGITQSELTDRLQRCPSTISKMVQRMEKAGFVARKPDPGDERLSRVYLTDAGRDIRPQVEEIWRVFEEEAFAGLSGKELGVFRDLLVRVWRNMEGGSCAE
jgi:DNA-binding MarR family transcriptional regulator